MNKRKVSIIIATVLVAAATVATVVSLKKQKGESTPKYVFLFIGDGMGLAHAIRFLPIRTHAMAEATSPSRSFPSLDSPGHTATTAA